jgi:hypothetical protein
MDNTSFLGLALFLWIVVAPAATLFVIGRGAGRQVVYARPLA